MSLFYELEPFDYSLAPSVNSDTSLNKLNSQHIQYVKEFIIPEMSKTDYKGCGGKVCVVGGSEVYCGAPYFSALSSLRLGADLSFIITCKENSIPLKSYSPEIIVYPYLYNKKSHGDKIPVWDESDDFIKCVRYLKNKIDVAVIGPGLGEVDEVMEKCLIYIMKEFMEKRIFLIFDADAISFFMMNQEAHELISSCDKCILTPNINELKKIAKGLLRFSDYNFDEVETNNILEYLFQINRYKLGQPMILVKGYFDVFFSTNNCFAVSIKNACLKRCAGLGDILTGLIAVFYIWGSKKKRTCSSELKKWLSPNEEHFSENIDTIVVFNACYFLKVLCKEAFKINNRGFIASDVINLIPSCFSQMYETKKELSTLWNIHSLNQNLNK